MNCTDLILGFTRNVSRDDFKYIKVIFNVACLLLLSNIFHLTYSILVIKNLLEALMDTYNLSILLFFLILQYFDIECKDLN